MNKESVLSAGQSIRKPSRGQQVSIDDFSSLLDVSRGWLKPDQVDELTAAIAEMFNDRNSNIDRSTETTITLSQPEAQVLLLVAQARREGVDELLRELLYDAASRFFAKHKG